MDPAPWPDHDRGREDNEHLDLRILPRRRMQRALWRRIALIIIVQFVAMLAILILLQGPWRRAHRADHGAGLAQLAADLLDSQFLHSGNAAAQGVLDRIAGQPGVAFAAVLDSRDRVILSGGEPASSLVREPIPPVPAAGEPGGVPQVDAVRNLLIHEVPVENGIEGSTFRVAIGLHDLSARRAVLDGVLAASAGLLVVLLVLLPLSQRRFRRWTQGLHHLHASVRRLAQGRALKPLPVGGDDEIAYLSIAFNDMAGKLSASRRALLNANAALERRVAQRTQELDEANTELEKKNEKLAELTETALRFTDDVAHEFRTPLTVIQEFASITADGLGGEVSDAQMEYLQFIITASGELAHLVDDFLDSGKLRARKLRVERDSCAVGDILEAVWPMLQARSSSRKVGLKREIEPGLPRVYADVEKVRRTLINLVTNAIKFSPKESVVSITARSCDSGGVMISVTDQGPGLTAEEVVTLFERFKQGQEGHRSSAKGFGLGLNIVRDLVAINLGTVLVESEVGNGSTFSFTLPTDAPATIVDFHLQRILERDHDAVVSALRVDAGSAYEDVRELQLFLAAVSYPTDVLLRGCDGRSFIVIGEAGDPDRWRQRLIQEHEQSRRRDGAGALRIEHLGSWPARESASHILSFCASSADAPDASDPDVASLCPAPHRG